jgi:hypothetical protein
VVVITPVATVPAELAGHATVIEWPLPDREEIAAILDAAVGALPETCRRGRIGNARRRSTPRSGCRARRLPPATRARWCSYGAIDPLLVGQEKRRVVARERVLEWIEPIEGGLDAVGGLDLLKSWLTTRHWRTRQRRALTGCRHPREPCWSESCRMR